MTGFGRAEKKEDGSAVSVEMRSLNHRYLDVEIRMPRNLQVLEPTIRELIGNGVSRGRVTATITVKGGRSTTSNLTADKQLATSYLELLQDLKREFNLNGVIELRDLLALPDIVSFDVSDTPDGALLECVKKAVQDAIDDMKKMRLREGEEIRKDLENRISHVNNLVRKIQEHSKANALEYFQKLKERVQIMIEAEALNEGRLETEVALLAEKMDVTEECIRFQSHNTLFLELLEKPESEGRKLNFLLQEMHREANTIGAKGNDSQLAHWVVEIKEEVEKLREQIQNIE